MLVPSPWRYATEQSCINNHINMSCRDLRDEVKCLLVSQMVA